MVDDVVPRRRMQSILALAGIGLLLVSILPSQAQLPAGGPALFMQRGLFEHPFDTSAVHTPVGNFVFGGASHDGAGCFTNPPHIQHQDTVTGPPMPHDGTPPLTIPGPPVASTPFTWLGGTSAIFDGATAYVFGGYTGTNNFAPFCTPMPGLPDHFLPAVCTDRIHTFTPPATLSVAGTVGLAPAILPSPLAYTSAVWDRMGQVAYIFGGYDCMGGVISDAILEFDPAAMTVTTVGLLPTPRFATSAVWAVSAACPAGCAYVMGGFDGASDLADIVQFTPPFPFAPTVAALPTPRSHTSAVWSGTDAYILGGRSGALVLPDIVGFDPTTGVAAPVPLATLASPGPNDPYPGISATSAVWHPAPGGVPGQGTVYVFGGHKDDYSTGQIRSWTP